MPSVEAGPVCSHNIDEDVEAWETAHARGPVPRSDALCQKVRRSLHPRDRALSLHEYTKDLSQSEIGEG